MLRPKIAIVTTLGMLLVVAGRVCADEPPSFEEFDVCTHSGKYCAEIRRVGTSQAPPYDQEYRLRVVAMSEDPPRKLWARSYEYDGYPEGELTEDGQRFVYVSHWYWSSAPVVTILSRDTRLTLSGREFRIPDSALRRTVSHRLWLAERPSPYRIVDMQVLVVSTIDGNTHDVDLTTGRLMP